jgi:hypothetical protein
VTDPDFIAKKLALIETSVRELGMLARPEEIARLAFVTAVRARLP